MSRLVGGAPRMSPASTALTGTTIGTTGSPWRAVVTPGGTVVPADGSPPLAWWIAADDRRQHPGHEPPTRQHLVEATPVVETAVRVPGGDALQRVYAVAGGWTVIEVENQSPLPFAAAFSHDRLRLSRPRSPLPPDAPGAVAFGVAHRTTLRLVLAHDGTTGPLPNG